jgi:hypothetical protein
MGATSSFFSMLMLMLNTEATLRTLLEKLRPRPRPVSLLLLLLVEAVGHMGAAGVTVAALDLLVITRTGSSAAVIVLRRRVVAGLSLLVG